jgi:hypothetical protein
MAGLSPVKDSRCFHRLTISVFLRFAEACHGKTVFFIYRIDKCIRYILDWVPIWEIAGRIFMRPSFSSTDR